MSNAGRSVPLLPEEWLSVGAITEEVEQRMEGFEHRPPVFVLDSARDLLGATVVDEGNPIAGATVSGKIYLFRDVLESRSDVNATLFHELLHYGIRRFLTRDQYISKMAALGERDASIDGYAEHWLRLPEGADILAQHGRDYAYARGVDEALATLAEPSAGEYLQTGIGQRTLRAITQWLANLANELGFNQVAAKIRAYKSQEAREFIQGVFQKLRDDAPAIKNDWTFTADPSFRRRDPERQKEAPIHQSKGIRTMSEPARQVTEYEKAQTALEYIDPDCDRLTWVRIAAALADEFGQDGFDLFDDWSRNGKTYQPNAARDTWKSVKPGRGISIASLYHEAKQSGFRPAEWQTQAAPARHDDGKRAAERAAAQAAREAADARLHAETAQKARDIFQKAQPVKTDHPYIGRKGLGKHPWLQAEAATVAPREMNAADLAKHLGYKPKADGVPLGGRVLLIPLIDGRKITTLEFIDEQGRKTALAGGLKRGSWSAPVPMGQHMATNPDTPIVIVEGWATAYSALYAFLRPEQQMPGAYVVAAGADTNLGNVARALRSQYPDTPIIIGADIGNPDSMKLARKAAASVDGAVMAPQFSEEQFFTVKQYLGKPPTDFNDQFAYYEATYSPLDGFLEDMNNAFQHAEFPQRTEFPELAQDAVASPAARAIPSICEAASTGDRKMDAQTPETSSKKAPGNPLYDIKTLPEEVKKAAREIFGNRQTLYAPKENEGPYSGEVHEIPGYLIQEVGPRSLVIHSKGKLEFASNRLQWMQENQMLNGHEVGIWYKGDQGNVYPFDRVRDDYERAVGSFKKSAKELGLPPEFAERLGKAFDKSMERINGLRREARAKAKESQSRSASTPEAPAAKAEEPQPTKSRGRKR